MGSSIESSDNKNPILCIFDKDAVDALSTDQKRLSHQVFLVVAVYGDKHLNGTLYIPVPYQTKNCLTSTSVCILDTCTLQNNVSFLDTVFYLHLWVAPKTERNRTLFTYQFEELLFHQIYFSFSTNVCTEKQNCNVSVSDILSVRGDLFMLQRHILKLIKVYKHFFERVANEKVECLVTRQLRQQR